MFVVRCSLLFVGVSCLKFVDCSSLLVVVESCLLVVVWCWLFMFSGLLLAFVGFSCSSLCVVRCPFFPLFVVIGLLLLCVVC